jgi:hypothetical protein
MEAWRHPEGIFKKSPTHPRKICHACRIALYLNRADIPVRLRDKNVLPVNILSKSVSSIILPWRSYDHSCQSRKRSPLPLPIKFHLTPKPNTIFSQLMFINDNQRKDKKVKKTAIPLLAIIGGLLLIACEQKPPQTCSEVLALSAKSGEPVLIELFAEW